MTSTAVLKFGGFTPLQRDESVEFHLLLGGKRGLFVDCENPLADLNPPDFQAYNRVNGLANPYKQAYLLQIRLRMIAKSQTIERIGLTHLHLD